MKLSHAQKALKGVGCCDKSFLKEENAPGKYPLTT